MRNHRIYLPAPEPIRIIKTASPVLIELVVHALLIATFISMLGVWSGLVSGGL